MLLTASRRVLATALRVRLGAAAARVPAPQRPALPWGVWGSPAVWPQLRYKSASAAGSPDEARLLLGFTCNVCGHRQHKTMSKHAYQNGVVLMQCDGCKNRHLIADNLGWFRDKRVNIEDLMREKSEEVRRLTDLDLLDGIETSQIEQALASRSPPPQPAPGVPRPPGDPAKE